MRGIAALDVAVSHVSYGSNTFLSLFSFADPAVDYFFCLSGFTLFLVYGQSPGDFRFKQFLVARFARVYPLYIIVLAVAAAYNFEFGYFANYSSRAGVLDGVRQVLMVNAWPIIGSGAHWAAPMWSLSIEAFCYVFMFPILLKVLAATRPWPLNFYLCLALILPFFALWFGHSFYNPAVNEQFIQVRDHAPHWVAVVRGVCMFTTGWACFRVWRDHQAITSALTRHTDVVAVAIVVVVVGSMSTVMDGYLVVLLAPAAILSITANRSVVARILSSEAVHFLGVISYSLYLWHWPITHVMQHWYPVLDRTPDLRTAISLAVSLLAAVASYVLIERPARGWIRKLSGRSPARAVQPVFDGIKG